MMMFGFLSNDPIETRVRDFVSVMRVPENLLSVRTYAECLAADLAAEKVWPEYLDDIFRNLRTTEQELPTIAQVMKAVRSQVHRAEFEKKVFEAKRSVKLGEVVEFNGSGSSEPPPAA